MKTKRGLRTVVLTAVFFCIGGSVFAVLSGAGTEANPYLIQSRADFDEFAGNSSYWASGMHTKLMCDIDLAGTTYTQAVIAPNSSQCFRGTFDGNGHMIYRLTINQPTKDYLGLFGYVVADVVTRSEVKNLGVDVTITGRNYVGGVAGYNDGGSITSCYVTGSVGGRSYVGGLAGYNYSGTIKSCYATCSVMGNTYIGGLVGYNNYGGLFSCYATGLVSGNPYIGGLVGKNDYGSINSCLWDIQTSGISDGVGSVNPDPAGAIGKTTAQMKDIQSYPVGDWSFVQGNVTLADWIMPSGGYPKLTWEVYPPVTIPNLKGLTQGQAQTTLNGLGLLSGATYSVYDVSVSAGLICETYPKSGTLVYAGLTPVHLLTAKGTRYAGGDGAATPYQIANIGNLMEMNNTPDDWNKSFVQTANIDLEGVTFSQSLIAPDISINPNFQGTKFTGIFDGNSHTISNLIINAPPMDYIGLFGYVGIGGQVKNLGIENIKIIGHSQVGGVAGANLGAVSACYTTGLVIGSDIYTGGLVGHNYDVVVCSNSSATVQGKSSTGGLVGFNYGSITSCYGTGAVSGTSYVGGLAGSNGGLIIACYASGKANGTSSVGGLTGSNSASIMISYSTGLVSGTGSDIGGLVGQNTSTTNACFWNTETSGQTVSAGGTGKTTAEMQTVLTYTEAGWDFVGETGNGSNDYWQMEEGQFPRFPVIVWTLGGGGTAANPYIISSPANLSQIWSRPGAYYKLGKSLDLNGLLWTAAVVPGFTGVFDGSGFAISNLTINQPLVNYIGLFGRVSGSAQIRNLELSNVSLNGRSSVGGLAGWNYGNFASCSAAGTINGYATVGGLIGLNNNGGALTFCSSACDVSGYSSCGGLVGYHSSSSLTSCYATGAISGTGTGIGGLVGKNYRGQIIQCYSSGKPTGTASIGGLCGSVDTGTGYADTGNFWDMETSETATSAMGTGKTTAEMKMLSTFTAPAVNWDFSDADGDGADWMMLRENEDYPRLAWQTIFVGDIAGLYGVDVADLMELANNWLEQGCPAGCEQADIDGSGQVDLDDFAIMASWEECQTVPVAYWAMDETSGTVVSDSVGGHPGQTVNMAGTPWVAGKVGNCLSFDGVDDSVVMTGYKGITGTQSRTCTAWIKTPGMASNTVIMSWGGLQWIFGLFGTGELTVYAGGPFIKSTALVNDNQWHHVAAVLIDDGSPDVSEIKLYIDGVLQAAVNSPGAISTAVGGDMLLGGFWNGTTPAGFFKGLLDEVRIYDRALTGAEVLGLYQNP